MSLSERSKVQDSLYRKGGNNIFLLSYICTKISEGGIQVITITCGVAWRVGAQECVWGFLRCTLLYSVRFWMIWIYYSKPKLTYFKSILCLLKVCTSIEYICWVFWITSKTMTTGLSKHLSFWWDCIPYPHTNMCIIIMLAIMTMDSSVCHLQGLCKKCC